MDKHNKQALLIQMFNNNYLQNNNYKYNKISKLQNLQVIVNMYQQ